jgi:hypothetical protein
VWWLEDSPVQVSVSWPPDCHFPLDQDGAKKIGEVMREKASDVVAEELPKRDEAAAGSLAPEHAREEALRCD